MVRIPYKKSPQQNFKNRPQSSRARPKTAVVSVLSTADYDRIRRNAKLSKDDEILNQNQILSEQKECQNAKARAHIERIKNYDKTHQKPKLSFLDREKIAQTNSLLAAARKAKENSYDAAKEMDQMLKYAKVVTIRDIQKAEHKKMEEDYNKKEEKLDLMMEIERLKELKFQQEKEANRKKQIREGSLIVVDQIKEKDMKRMKDREQTAKEGEMMRRQMRLLLEEDRRNEEKKRLENARLAKEIENINKMSILNKEKKKLAEKELDLQIQKYNIEKIKKEEEELQEKKRIQAEKERETQKLREKQERVQDKQAELDELRAKRAFEESERKAREKERQELEKKQRQMKELIEENEKQKLSKNERLKQAALQDQMEYEYIIKHQLKDMEEERRQEEEYQRKKNENGEMLRRQIKEREEKNKVKAREVAEEAREIEQNLEDYKRTMERIKKEKLDEMEKYNIKKIYRADLEKYKIH